MPTKMNPEVVAIEDNRKAEYEKSYIRAIEHLKDVGKRSAWLRKHLAKTYESGERASYSGLLHYWDSVASRNVAMVTESLKMLDELQALDTAENGGEQNG